MAQNNVRTGQPEDFMRIQDLFYLCLSKWYWFVISLGITLSVAILYVLVTPPVYMRSAALLIKDESKGQSLSGEVGGSFSDLGLFQANTNVNNELISLQSPAIMLDVVNRLRLDVAYHTDGAFIAKSFMDRIFRSLFHLRICKIMNPCLLPYVCWMRRTWNYPISFGRVRSLKRPRS